MIVTLIAQDQISTISLPERVSGRYWIPLRELDGSSIYVADVEGIQENWILHNSSFLAVFDEKGYETDHLLSLIHI